MPLVTLTVADAELLKQLLKEVRDRPIGKGRTGTELSWGAGEDHQAPEVYLAKANADIPARSGTTMGVALATLQGIDASDDGIYEHESVTRPVYNPSSSMISEGDYFPIWRSKEGHWLVGSSGGTRTQRIRFKIDDASVAWEAVVDVIARPCGMGTVAGEVDGQVTVYDPCRCFLDEPAADLVGRCGWATYMDPTGIVSTGTGTLDAETGTGTDVTACVWEIDGLCCPAC